MRESVWYWVRPLNSDPDYWIIAFWFKEGWARLGFENLCQDKDFEEIDERQIKRDESKNA